jgi:hypothetical protein
MLPFIVAIVARVGNSPDLFSAVSKTRNGTVGYGYIRGKTTDKRCWLLTRTLSGKPGES